MAIKKKEENQSTKYDSYQNMMNGAQNSAGSKPATAGQGTKHDSFLAIMDRAPGASTPGYTQTQAPTFNPNDNPWYQQAQQLMGQIQNRGPFQFKLNENALYQQYKQNYQKLGQQAMMDTMGQAAGLTGGYGSSYAQNVGQQAYNDYLTKLGDIVPELYAQERAAYDAEGNNLYQMLSAARSMYDTDYGMWRDQVGDARYADELAYGRQRDALNDQWRQREYDDSRADLLYNRQYQEGRDRIADQRYADELAYGRNRDSVNDQRYADQLEYERGRDALSDQWREREYNDSRSDSNYSRIMNMLSHGYMPSAEELQAAGISQGYAQYLVNMYAQQQAGAGTGSSGGGYSGGGYSGGGYTQTPSDEEPTTPPTGGYGPGLDTSTYNGVRQTIYYALGSGNYQTAMAAFDQVAAQLDEAQYTSLLTMIQEWMQNHQNGANQNSGGQKPKPSVPKPGSRELPQ